MITQMQLIQFIIMMSQAGYLLYVTCPNVRVPFPRNVTVLYFFYILSLFILFSNFFIRTYLCGRKASSGEKKSVKSDGKKSKTV